MFLTKEYYLNGFKICVHRNMDLSTDLKAKYDEGKVFTEYVEPKGWAGHHFKSETLCDCMESISLCELQFGLINDRLAVGER